MTNPMLKKLENIKQLFSQVQKNLAMIHDNLNEVPGKEAIQNAKEMLKYIEKANILKNSESILEQINELGIKHQKIKSRYMKKSPEPV